MFSMSTCGELTSVPQRRHFAGLFVFVALGIGYVIIKNKSEEVPIYEAELIEEKDTSKTT